MSSKSKFGLAAAFAVGCCAVVALPASAYVPVGSGTHPWAIVLCNFQNQQLDPAPASYFNQMYGDAGAGSGQFNQEDWWHDVSFGQLSTAGTVVVDGSHADANGWYTVPKNRDTWGYTENRFQKIVDCANAASQDVNYANYYGVMAIFPEATTTLAAPVNATQTTITVTDTSTSPPPSVATTNYFPTTPFLTNINDGTSGNNETVDVTNISGTTWTVVRGANGTTATSHAVSSGEINVAGDYGETDNNPSGPGQSTVTLSSGTFFLGMVVVPNENNLTGSSHEMGHGFGFKHSRKLSTSTVDYKDATDDMSAYDGTFEFTTLGTFFGGPVLGSLPGDKGPGLDSQNLDIQGWIPGPGHFFFNNSSPPNQSTIILHALSDPHALPLPAGQFLEARVPATVAIPVPNGKTSTSDYYTVEYRQIMGWDSGFPSFLGSPGDVVLHLHAVDPNDSYPYGYWVDSTPLGHSGFLAIGDEYVDAANNFYLGVNAMSAGAMAATVSVGSAKMNTVVGYTGSSSGAVGSSVTLSAHVSVAGSGASIPYAAVAFSIGSNGCTAVTDVNGNASCGALLTQLPGPYGVVASYSGDSVYNASSQTEPFTILKATPTLITSAPATSLDGQPTSDTGLLAGGFHPSGSITFHAYGPDDPGCTVDPFGPQTTSVAGNGSYGSPSVTPYAMPGHYRWVASYSGDAFNNAAGPTMCGDPAEIVNVLPAADLTITKADGAPGGHVLQGQQLTYTLGVSNSGPDPADNVMITDPIPASTVFAGASPGCTFSAGTVACPLGTVGVGPANAKTVLVVVLVVGPTTPISNTDTDFTTTANTNPVHSATDSTIVDPLCTVTMSENVAGSLVVKAGEGLCLSGAKIGGSITVQAGGWLTSNGSTIAGALTATGARAVTVCTTTFNGPAKVIGTADMVRFGDDDDTPFCGGNTLQSITVETSGGGTEIYGNMVTGSVAVLGNDGASPLSEDKTPEVELNTITGSLSCLANVPGVTNDGSPNKVKGGESGQCAKL
jgi:uncharacterized repeat protein (TIGR01451 family)